MERQKGALDSQRLAQRVVIVTFWSLGQQTQQRKQSALNLQPKVPIGLQWDLIIKSLW